MPTPTKPLPSLELVALAHAPWRNENIVARAEALVPEHYGGVGGCADKQTAYQAVRLLRLLWNEFKREHELL